MALKARIKFQGDVPWPMEHRMCTKLGFRVYSRKAREFVIFEKHQSKWKPAAHQTDELPEAIQKLLNSRIQTICGHFGDPESHKDIIRQRLRNIGRTLPALQEKFIHDWMELNLTEDQ